MQPPAFVPRFRVLLARGATSGEAAPLLPFGTNRGPVCLQTGAVQHPAGVARETAVDWVIDRIPARF